MRRGMRGGAVLLVLLSGLACGVKKDKPEAADLEIITHGDRVDLATHLAAGKYTVVDFYAAWCPPCRIVGPAIERLAAKESGRLAVRKVDIVDWTMPVVEQYAIEALPHLMLYGPDGKRVADGDAVYDELVKIFGESAQEVRAAGDAIGVETAPGAPTTDAQGREQL